MSDEKTVLERGTRMRNKQLILAGIFVALSLSPALAQEAVPVMVNDVLALKFVSDDSETFVYFKKYKDEDAFAIQVLEPRWSPQNRPYVVGSKPANGSAAWDDR
jgi:hypothetical protein